MACIILMLTGMLVLFFLIKTCYALILNKEGLVLLRECRAVRILPNTKCGGDLFLYKDHMLFLPDTGQTRPLTIPLDTIYWAEARGEVICLSLTEGPYEHFCVRSPRIWEGVINSLLYNRQRTQKKILRKIKRRRSRWDSKYRCPAEQQWKS